MIVAFMEPIPGIGSNALSIMEYLPRTPELERDSPHILRPRGSMVARARAADRVEELTELTLLGGLSGGMHPLKCWTVSSDSLIRNNER